jgi:Raf kinase inhibitor-like YbhB/YbcL family protein
MELTSRDFTQGALIPRRHTCVGENVSPALFWRDAPQGTQSFALIVEDPDAPSGTYTHWIAYNIPPDRKELPAGIAAEKRPNGFLQGQNDFGNAGYGGPCPPHGDQDHRYFFRLYALDAMLSLKAGAAKDDLEAAMDGHILAKAELMGQFGQA